jgi:formylglycine-generating enzyme required for sulfatase activity
VHDSDDDASVRAIQACRAARATEAATELFSLTGRTSARVAGSLAGCTDLRQILAVIALGELAGADADPRTEALRLQEEIFQRESVPIPEADTTHMVLIESEEFVVGLETVEGLPGWVPVDDVIPARRAKVPPFFIDRQPVTNREYDAFVAEIEEDGHVWCHHDEPRDTDHARSTRFDERLRPDDPATGVSWYDAYAFARWRGKKLPSDLQWELAARGPRGQLYPWGDSFLPEACNWLGLCLGLELPTRDRWVAAISSLDPASLARLTRPSRDFPLNVSYYGVADLIGNVWEWTRTRYLDRGELEPRFRGLDPIEYMGDWSAVACVKGGSWSSGGELLLPAYRGRRPVLERGPECGFRCVYEP